MLIALLLCVLSDGPRVASQHPPAEVVARMTEHARAHALASRRAERTLADTAGSFDATAEARQHDREIERARAALGDVMSPHVSTTEAERQAALAELESARQARRDAGNVFAASDPAHAAAIADVELARRGWDEAVELLLTEHDATCCGGRVPLEAVLSWSGSADLYPLLAVPAHSLPVDVPQVETRDGWLSAATDDLDPHLNRPGTFVPFDPRPTPAVD